MVTRYGADNDALLPDSSKTNHDPERRVMDIEDDKILLWIKSKKLVYQNGDVFSYDPIRHCYKVLKPQFRKHRRRYQFHRGQNGVKYHRTIMANRLIWMITHEKLIPPDYDIDHKDGNKANDNPNNLRLRKASENRSDNHRHDMNTAYQLGQQTKISGGSYRENPYRENTDRYYDWLQGYNNTHDEFPGQGIEE